MSDFVYYDLYAIAKSYLELNPTSNSMAALRRHSKQVRDLCVLTAKQNLGEPEFTSIDQRQI